ncbi:hypothetical protein IMG5_003570 [Ichthyophthirius multifiliis]|uniref:Transmembrane protein n=1 Tax=Ichthyophthirius multifiliis TaxID=5932 RepID=G0QJA6_ICHMU|nr:hypothetical protein IMG5_003570 [Ichthyophthirius multifiliis]EGR34696.1 hypothetical protein IMG5_003570 [Ichthyophthirius multifiliis]|eukprot:XP_004040000.1 hypothetical protein IMG5_003570 [Ichthyophthirius multifiliis]
MQINIKKKLNILSKTQQYQSNITSVMIVVIVSQILQFVPLVELKTHNYLKIQNTVNAPKVIFSIIFQPKNFQCISLDLQQQQCPLQLKTNYGQIKVQTYSLLIDNDQTLQITSEINWNSANIASQCRQYSTLVLSYFENLKYMQIPPEYIKITNQNRLQAQIPLKDITEKNSLTLQTFKNQTISPQIQEQYSYNRYKHQMLIKINSFINSK